MRKVPLLLLALSMGLSLAGQSQELPTATRITGVDWYRANLTKFKPGTADEARQIIYEHFIKADQAVGRNPIPFNFTTGEWDHVVFFPLQGRPADLEWSPTDAVTGLIDLRPIDERWWAALADLEGGVEAARALVERFGELVQRQETHIVQRRQ